MVNNMGKRKKGVPDGTGPFEGSYMAKTGHKGKKAGHKRGDCE